MDDEDLLARIRNLSTALNNLSDSDEDFGENVGKEPEISEADRREEELENQLRDLVENFFDICDDDKDGYIFDDDSAIFRDRIKQQPKKAYLPLLGWLKCMPHETIKNTSRAMFVEDVFIAFDKCYPDDPEKSIATLTALIKILNDSIELEKKESNQGQSDSEAFSDHDDYAQFEEIDVEPTSETPKADPGKEVITTEDVKKDPTRVTSMPEKGLDWKPHKKTFKAKKRKRKKPNTQAPAIPKTRERKAGPREIVADTNYKPYKPKKTPTHKRAKTAPLASKYQKRDPGMNRDRKLGPREIGKTKGWKAASFKSTDSGFSAGEEIYQERLVGTHRRQQSVPYFRNRSLGPREIGRTRDYKPAKYDFAKSIPGVGEEVYPERIPKVKPISMFEKPRKTGPREETYPEGWTPPPKEWERQLWRPNPPVKSSRKKIAPRRAKTVSHLYSKTNPTLPKKPRKRDPMVHKRAKSVGFSLANFSSKSKNKKQEPVVIKRKKKKSVEEAGESFKPRERASLEGVFSEENENDHVDDDTQMFDMASDPIEGDISPVDIDDDQTSI